MAGSSNIAFYYNFLTFCLVFQFQAFKLLGLTRIILVALNKFF